MARLAPPVSVKRFRVIDLPLTFLAPAPCIVMIARSSKAWLCCLIVCSTRAILWDTRTSGRRIRPAYQAGVGDVVQVDKLSKVFIYRNKDSVF